MTPRLAVLGSAQTRHESSKGDVHVTQMLYDTTQAALESAGLELGNIDTIISASCDVLDGISIGNCFTCESMGGYMKEETRVEDDGILAAIYTLMRMMSGDYQTALVVAYSKSSQAPAYFYSGLSCDPYVQRPLGLEGHSLAALQSRKYMDRHGVSERDIARVSVRNRQKGVHNPHALLQEEISLDQVLASPYVCDPLHEAMIFPQTDGVCAVVFGSEAIAKKAKNPPAWIEGMGYFTDSYYPGYRDLTRVITAEKAAAKACDMAGIKDPIKELDVVELSAPYAHEELMLTEALGLCPQGSGKIFSEDALALNPSGGALCANPIIGTGLIRVAEIALQVTGQAEARQVKGAETGLAHGSCGLCMQSNGVMILRGE